MTVTCSNLVLVAILACVVSCSWCLASDHMGYIHVGCYYEVRKCWSLPYFIKYQGPNTSMFDICLNFTRTRGWRSFGIQALQQTNCITGPDFHIHLNPTCFHTGSCSSDRSNVTHYSYNVYINGNMSVLEPPTFLQRPTSKIVSEETKVILVCNATGSPFLSIVWHKDGHALDIKNSRYHVSVDNRTFAIIKVNRTDQGQYRCDASNSLGTATSSANLTVNFPPTIKAALPKGVILQLGKTLRLKCDVYGDPQPFFQWTKGETKSEKTILSNQNNYQLVIKDVRVKDAAYYGCTATNRVGAVILDAVFVDVDTSLDIINGDQTFNATIESPATIYCTASSEITPEIKMIKNDVELQTVTKVSDDKRVVTAEFTVRSVTTDDSGPYTCVAKNRRKEFNEYVYLTVHVLITVEMDVSLKNKAFTKDLRNKSSEAYKNLEMDFITEMTKVYQNESGFTRIEVLDFTNGSVSVRFRVVYKIEVRKPEDKPLSDSKMRIANVLVRKVKNTGGIVGKLQLKEESLKPRVKPSAPRNLTALDIKKTTLTLMWNPPLYHDHYSVKSYVVKCREFGSSWKTLEVDGKHTNTLVLDSLQADTSYSIKIHAVSHLGEGLASKIIEVKTLSDFWGTFTKVVVPFCILLVIGVMMLVYLRRRRRQRNQAKLKTEEDGKRCYDDFLHDQKNVECSGDAMEMVELPLRYRNIPRENLVLDKELGSGQFGVVFKGFLKEKDEEEEVPCAVKMLKPGSSEDNYRDLFNELEIMSSVEEHPNIINLLGACKGGGGPLYVMVEFAENGCLLEYLRDNRISVAGNGGNLEQASSLSNQEKIRLALDIANGMKHLASHKCVHRDLAARNVLLGKNMIAKVADFGLARDVYERGFYEKLSTKGKLPAKWMSVEALETMTATSESDVWSFGVLLWEIETGGKMPYAGLSYKDLVKALKSGVRLYKPANCSEEMYSIMKDCWDANPENRPKFEVLSLVLDNLLMAYLGN